MVVSKKVVLESEISAVNLIVGWNSFAFLMNCKIPSLVVVQNDAISSIKRFHSTGFVSLLSMIWVSISPMNMFVKATADFHLIFLPCSERRCWDKFKQANISALTVTFGPLVQI